MISFLTNVVIVFGGVYAINRLLYRFYFPKKPTFLPLRQLMLIQPSYISRIKHQEGENLYKIVINLDDHNRLISPLLMKTVSRPVSGTRIFRVSLNVLLPKYENSIYLLNYSEFLSFCEQKANLFGLGVMYFNEFFFN